MSKYCNNLCDRAAHDEARVYILLQLVLSSPTLPLDERESNRGGLSLSGSSYSIYFSKYLTWRLQDLFKWHELTCLRKKSNVLIKISKNIIKTTKLEESYRWELKNLSGIHTIWSNRCRSRTTKVIVCNTI